jgi:biopolymer transport protein ExbD
VQFRKPRKRTVKLDISPLIDCVFLLLIFYAVSTTFIEKPGIKLELPASENQEAGVEARIVVTLSRDNALFLNNRPVNRDELRRLLAGELEKKQKKFVILRADQKVEHGRVVEVIDMIKAAGADGLTIATKKK